LFDLNYDHEEEEAVLATLRSRWLSTGPRTLEFERLFAEALGVRHAVAVANCTSALHLALWILGIQEGDEVIVPSNTYIATWLAVSAVGAQVVPVEPDACTYNLDPGLVEDAIGPRTRAIVAVHLYGQTAAMEALGEIARRRGVTLVADAAQAHGAELGGIPSAFSFYPSKNLGALGDGGAVVTDDAALAGCIRVLGNYGSRTKHSNEIRGVNSRLDPLQAAVLRVKLQHLTQWNRQRRRIAELYLNQLDGIPDLVLPCVAGGSDSVWHLFPIRHPQRDWLARQLALEEIGTMIHYPVPPHLSEAYRDAGYRHGSFPIAERIAAEELSLPLHPHLTGEQVEEIIGSVCLAACVPMEDVA